MGKREGIFPLCRCRSDTGRLSAGICRAFVVWVSCRELNDYVSAGLWNQGDFTGAGMLFSTGTFLYSRLAVLFLCGIPDEPKMLEKDEEDKRGLQGVCIFFIYVRDFDIAGNLA